MTLEHPRTGEPFDSPVSPGTGWPGDPAGPDTVVATTAAKVRRLAARAREVAELDAEVSVCRACPRLVAWREKVAVEKRRSFAGEPYWGRPVPSLGAAAPSILVVGLAPAANGANRTGRVFTGDRSGDVLFAALHRAGLASSPLSVDAADGLVLVGTRIVAPVRCAPPDNAPTPQERETCAPWLAAEWQLVRPSVRAIVALGGFAWKVALDMVRAGGGTVPRPQPKFGHLVLAPLASGVGEVSLIGCFHPSQQNTFTGRLTPAMLDDVFSTAVAIAN
ncbi:uracil-DNA glycosylase [Mycobacterium yunnanensis]|uniref:Type-5 uracil-DNA glycosylase n=1 Tax=Mycobacterium yunnanensis TaxID=368477 RepID=A0A9X2YW76_9MYCO|nr:uracil-DNA glycosylase [Mycobacterium yunnanensis]MCV7419860.1 uracil-DNA glycosylase [Mycobacterium yunnanensis]